MYLQIVDSMMVVVLVFFLMERGRVRNLMFLTTLVPRRHVTTTCLTPDSFNCLLPFDSPPCFLPRIAYYLFLLPATFLCCLYQISGTYRGPSAIQNRQSSHTDC